MQPSSNLGLQVFAAQAGLEEFTCAGARISWVGFTASNAHDSTGLSFGTLKFKEGHGL